MEKRKITKIEDLDVYQKAIRLYEQFLDDSDIIGRDYRGREIVKQLIRSVSSISANIEEGYGRKFGKEFIHYLRISRGSARESKGWYFRSRRFLSEIIIQERMSELDTIIAMLTSLINKLSKLPET